MRSKDLYVFLFILLISTYVSYRYNMENKGKQKTQIEITRYYGRSGTKYCELDGNGNYAYYEETIKE